MTLSTRAQRVIFHKGMAAAHLIAAELDCAVSDVLDVLVTAPFSAAANHFAEITPSQPNPPPSAADTPAPPTAGDTTDGGAHQRSPLASPSVEPVPTPDLHDRVIAAYKAHPDWTNGRLAAHVGCAHSTVSSWVSPLRRAARAATAEALKTPTQPQHLDERAGPPTPRAEIKHHPAATPTYSLKPAARVTLPNEPRRIVPTHAPKGAGSGTRFFVRDDNGRYLHQSLDPSETGIGPLMTTNRKQAWHDTMERYRGAMKKWPELANMHMEAASA